MKNPMLRLLLFLRRQLHRLGIHWWSYFVEPQYRGWHRRCAECGWEQRWVAWIEDASPGHWVTVRRPTNNRKD